MSNLSRTDGEKRLLVFSVAAKSDKNLIFPKINVSAEQLLYPCNVPPISFPLQSMLFPEERNELL